MRADISTELSIAFSPITALHSCSHNARTHSRRQIRQIADSLQEFGYTKRGEHLYGGALAGSVGAE
jgi:hypothetical protein